MTVALGIEQDKDGNGLSALAHRHIIKSHWLNVGIVNGLAVSGRSDLTYQVAAGVAVCSRGDTDGYTEAYWPGGQTGRVAAGGTNPRIDLIWIKAQDPTQGDSSNTVIVGVTQGVAAASPTAPAVPAGCTPLAERFVPAGVASTNSTRQSGDVNYAIAAGGSLGLLGEYWDTRDMKGDSNVGRHFYEMATTFTLPTDRLLQFDFKCVYSCSKVDAKNPAAYRSEWAVAFQLDGADLPHSAAAFCSFTPWQTHETSYTTVVKKGTHTARINSWLQYGEAPYFHYSDKGALWVGRRMQIWDRGMAQ